MKRIIMLLAAAVLMSTLLAVNAFHAVAQEEEEEREACREAVEKVLKKRLGQAEPVTKASKNLIQHACTGK